MAVFWDVKIALMMDAVSTSETSVYFYQTTYQKTVIFIFPTLRT
jgi:hypothetical protein